MSRLFGGADFLGPRGKLVPSRACAVLSLLGGRRGGLGGPGCRVPW